jgi:nitroreductase
MDAIEALRSRRSVRAYSLKPVAREVLEEILDCARLAPSAMNLQPWDFVVITDKAGREDISEQCGTAPFLAEAPVLVVVACRKVGTFLEDAACAATVLMVAARAHGLGSCWFHLLDKAYMPQMRADLGVPEDRQLVCVLSLGYGEMPPAPDKRALEDVVHWEKFAG